jgi:hypothetical protein
METRAVGGEDGDQVAHQIGHYILHQVLAPSVR